MTLRRIAAGLGAILGLAASPAAPALAQSVSPAEAPAAWVSYARMTSEAVSGWLGEDTEPSRIARGHIGAAYAAPESRPLVLRLWIAADGRVERAEFPPLADVGADADLREVLIGRALSAPPPDMLQPLRIMVEPGGSG